jgi:Matrixin.
VAGHELGHVLMGEGHSPVEADLMGATISGGERVSDRDAATLGKVYGR